MSKVSEQLSRMLKILIGAMILSVVSVTGFEQVLIHLKAEAALRNINPVSTAMAKIYKDKVSASIQIHVKYKESNIESSGSGFYVNKNTIITAYHVIRSVDKGRAKLTIKFSDGSISKATVVYVDVSKDIAILTTDRESGVYYDMIANPDLFIGKEVYTISSISTLYNFIGHGFITGLNVEIGLIHKLFQSNIGISQGMSGGPILTKDGRVIGMSIAIFNNRTLLGAITPSSELVKALEIYNRNLVQLNSNLIIRLYDKQGKELKYD